MDTELRKRIEDALSLTLRRNGAMQMLDLAKVVNFHTEGEKDKWGHPIGDRFADRWLQKLRRKGEVEYFRDGRQAYWRFVKVQ